MTEYVQLRHHCEPCGLFHSEIRHPDDAGYNRFWNCPCCGVKLFPSETCAGKSAMPTFGFHLTHFIRQASSLMDAAFDHFQDQREGKRRGAGSAKSFRAAADTRRMNARA